MSTIIRVLLGLGLLTLGRKLFWLFVAAVGFEFGFFIAERFLQRRADDLVALGIGVLFGIIAALVAVFLKELAIYVGGFLAGGAILVRLLETFSVGGPRLENTVPKYGMVFLNACQVGTAGVTLGQFAGFPGALLRAGTSAVIGPIWEVNDVAAHQLVVEFYEDALEKNVPVSETLRKLRAGCDPTATTTPLAYIFYGHPDLVLKK